MPNPLELRQIRKTFYSTRTLPEMIRNPFASKKGSPVLKEVTFSLAEGEVFCLMGPNGAGKTTLLKIIAGLILPEGGKIFFYGKEAVDGPSWAGRLLGFVSGDEQSFYWQLTARQTLGFFSALYDLPLQEAKERIHGLSQRLGLERELDKPYMRLSSGNRQKLALIRGLLHDPQVLLLDEPTKSLDPKGSRELLEWIRTHLSGKERRTVLFTTHRLEEASFCHRVGILSRGKLSFQGDQRTFLEESRKEGFLKQFFSGEKE